MEKKQYLYGAQNEAYKNNIKGKTSEMPLFIRGLENLYG